MWMSWCELDQLNRARHENARVRTRSGNDGIQVIIDRPIAPVATAPGSDTSSFRCI
jgi:hypothetical protein